MRNSLFILFIFISFLSAVNSQYDFSVHYNKQIFTDWNSVIEASYANESDIFQNAIGFGAGYRYFPHQTRIGYVPEIGISYAKNEKSALFQQEGLTKYILLQAYLSLSIQIFPLDLEGDCNCPTFGKQNDFFKKAFFLKFIPGLAYQNLQLENINANSVNHNFVYSFGFGTGINLALSQKLSIAPEVSYHFIYSENWNEFADFHIQKDSYDKTSAYKFQAGLRFSLYLN